MNFYQKARHIETSTRFLLYQKSCFSTVKQNYRFAHDPKSRI